MNKVYIVNLDVDYEGTLESYVFLTRKEADEKVDHLLAYGYTAVCDMIRVYRVTPGTDYLRSRPVRQVQPAKKKFLSVKDVKRRFRPAYAELRDGFDSDAQLEATDLVLWLEHARLHASSCDECSHAVWDPDAETWVDV